MKYIINNILELYSFNYLGYLFILFWISITLLSFLNLSPLPRFNKLFKSPYVIILLYSNIIYTFYNFNLSIIYLIVAIIIIKFEKLFILFSLK